MIEIGKFTEEDILSLAREGYENGNPEFEIEKEKTALLIIDMQDEFVKPNWAPCWVPEATKQVPAIKKLLEHCRANSIPVIYTVFSRTNNFLDRPNTGKYMPNRFNNLGIDQSMLFNDGKVWRELEPKPGEIIIHKPSYGAFYDTPLETILKNMGKDTIIICGTLTNYCCGLTARQAYERGFKVVFGSDINATDDPQMQEPELKVLRKGFAKVLSSKEIINSL